MTKPELVILPHIEPGDDEVASYDEEMHGKHRGYLLRLQRTIGCGRAACAQEHRSCCLWDTEW